MIPNILIRFTPLVLYFLVIQQSYKSSSEEEYVILGNDALMKCKIPSFVSDFVSVVSWVDNDGRDFYPKNNGSLKIVLFRILGPYSSSSPSH